MLWVGYQNTPWLLPEGIETDGGDHRLRSPRPATILKAQGARAAWSRTTGKRGTIAGGLYKIGNDLRWMVPFRAPSWGPESG